MNTAHTRFSQQAVFCSGSIPKPNFRVFSCSTCSASAMFDPPACLCCVTCAWSYAFFVPWHGDAQRSTEQDALRCAQVLNLKVKVQLQHTSQYKFPGAPQPYCLLEVHPCPNSPALLVAHVYVKEQKDTFAGRLAAIIAVSVYCESEAGHAVWMCPNEDKASPNLT
jgi:hypothetical protein